MALLNASIAIYVMARTLMASSCVPLNLEAVSTAIYLINRLPTPLLNWDSPYNKLFGSTPCYTDLCTFGCSCYPHLGNYFSNKLLPRSVECIFLGYNSQHKGYRCLNLKTSKVYISRHVRFDKTSFMYARSTHSSALAQTSDMVFVPVFTPPESTSSGDPILQPELPTTELPEDHPPENIAPPSAATVTSPPDQSHSPPPTKTHSI